jgi:small-conductance mechanosensitive channel
MNALNAWMEGLATIFIAQQIVLLLLTLGVAFYWAKKLGHWFKNESSLIFGQSTAQGVLFPFLALVLGFAIKSVLHQFKWPSDLMVSALPLLLCWLVINLCQGVTRFIFPTSQGMRELERLLAWGSGIFCVFWVFGLMPDFMQELEQVHLSFGKTQVDLRTLLEGALSCVAMIVLTLWFSTLIERQIIKPTVQDLSMRKVLSNLLRTCLVTIGLLFSLSAVGLDLTALSVLGGALGVGLGFGLQKLAANYVSGFVILLERSIRIGDFVRIEEFEGQITDIKTRYTLIRAYSGIESIVPNEVLMTQRIENYSLQDPHVMLSTSITLAYGTDVQQAQRLLIQAALACDRVQHDPAPNALLEAFDSDGLTFKLVYWIKDPQNGQLNVRSMVNCNVYLALKEAKIEIPRPQREIHWPQGSSPPV